MSNRRLLAVASMFVTVLCCWAIFPYKWVRKAVFRHRKANAMYECRHRATECGHRYYVVQNGMRVYVGERRNFREWNRKNKKALRLFANFDYRNALIYHCDADGTDFYYAREFKLPTKRHEADRRRLLVWKRF